MDCPVCGSSDRKALGGSRYQCMGPGRLVGVTPPPTVGSTWGPVTIDGSVHEPCGVVFTDMEELRERHRTTVLLMF